MKYTKEEKDFLRAVISCIKEKPVGYLSQFVFDKDFIKQYDIRVVKQCRFNNVYYYSLCHPKSYSPQQFYENYSGFIYALYLIKDLFDDGLLRKFPAKPYYNKNGYWYGNDNISHRDQTNNIIYFADDPDKAYIIKENIDFECFDEYLTCAALCTPKLNKLVDNNFETTEEKTLTATRYAAVISLLGLIIAVIGLFSAINS